MFYIILLPDYLALLLFEHIEQPTQPIIATRQRKKGRAPMQTYDIHIDGTGQELTRHGSFDFPLAVYTTTVSKNILGFIDWHWHKELQFCMVVRDSIRVSVEGSTFTLRKGEGLFVNSGRLHSIENAPGADATYICLDFHPRLIAGFEGSAVQAKFIAPFTRPEAAPYLVLNEHDPWAARILDLLLRTYRNYSSSTPDELQIQIWLAQAWHETARHLERGTGDAALQIRPQMRAVLEYVAEHLSEPITLEDAAACAGLARSTCSREFKRQLGCTLTAYILNARLQEASRLLLATDLSVAEVAVRCGFSSSSYFISKFGEKIGSSPNAYRKEHAGERTSVLQTLYPPKS